MFVRGALRDFFVSGVCHREMTAKIHRECETTRASGAWDLAITSPAFLHYRSVCRHDVVSERRKHRSQTSNGIAIEFTLVWRDGPDVGRTTHCWILRKQFEQDLCPEITPVSRHFLASRSTADLVALQNGKHFSRNAPALADRGGRIGKVHLASNVTQTRFAVGSEWAPLGRLVQKRCRTTRRPVLAVLEPRVP